MDRIQREKQFHDEEFERYDRRRLEPWYRVAAVHFDRFLESCVENARNRRVLEIGCGPGSVTLKLARVARHVTAIDLSDTAIRQASERAARAGITNAEFRVMNAEQLDFPANSFEFVCGRAILHHLDLRVALPALARTLSPSGRALFLEPLGHNPVINWYRRRTPELRTADEHPLLRSDLERARASFRKVEVKPAVLLSLAAGFLPDGTAFRVARSLLAGVDAVLVAVPGLRWLAWTSVWLFEDPRPVP
jgi:SAM-dependent methyltransferase